MYEFGGLVLLLNFVQLLAIKPFRSSRDLLQSSDESSCLSALVRDWVVAVLEEFGLSKEVVFWKCVR